MLKYLRLIQTFSMNKQISTDYRLYPFLCWLKTDSLVICYKNKGPLNTILFALTDAMRAGPRVSLM